MVCGEGLLEFAKAGWSRASAGESRNDDTPVSRTVWRSATCVAGVFIRSVLPPLISASTWPVTLAAMNWRDVLLVVFVPKYWSARGPLPSVRNKVAAARGRGVGSCEASATRVG